MCSEILLLNPKLFLAIGAGREGAGQGLDLLLLHAQEGKWCLNPGMREDLKSFMLP